MGVLIHLDKFPFTHAQSVYLQGNMQALNLIVKSNFKHMRNDVHFLGRVSASRHLVNGGGGAEAKDQKVKYFYRSFYL